MDGKKSKITLCLYAYSITEVAPFATKYQETAKEVVIHLNEKLHQKGNFPGQCWFLDMGTHENRIFTSYPEMRGSPFVNDMVKEITAAEVRKNDPNKKGWRK